MWKTTKKSFKENRVTRLKHIACDAQGGNSIPCKSLGLPFFRGKVSEKQDFLEYSQVIQYKSPHQNIQTWLYYSIKRSYVH